MIIKFILSYIIIVLLVGRRYFDILRDFTYPNISSVMESNLVFEFVSYNQIEDVNKIFSFRTVLSFIW